MSDDVVVKLDEHLWEDIESLANHMQLHYADTAEERAKIQLMATFAHPNLEKFAAYAEKYLAIKVKARIIAEFNRLEEHDD